MIGWNGLRWNCSVTIDPPFTRMSNLIVRHPGRRVSDEGDGDDDGKYETAVTEGEEGRRQRKKTKKEEEEKRQSLVQGTRERRGYSERRGTRDRWTA